MSNATHQTWLSLSETEKLRPERHGSKVISLAELAKAGLPTPPGWVLDCAAARAAGEDASHRRRAAEALLSLHPTPRWMLRSSSPLEDLPGQSAAGLFASVSADAVPEDIAAGLATVARSGRSTAVKELLDLESDAPVAVLAQPQLNLSAWWTVELDAADATGWFEGWTGASNPRWMRGSIEEADDLLPLLRRFAVWKESGHWLLEVGRDESVVILQARPAPRRRRRFSVSQRDLLPERDDIPRFPLHPGDEDIDWVWDGAHSPTPLCPLLAGLFHLWLRRQPDWPSRILHGRWHDRATSLETETAGAPPDPHEYRVQFASLERLLSILNETFHTLNQDPTGAWPGFMARWIEFQEQYYDPATSRLRQWARRTTEDLATRGTALPPLKTTAAARAHALDALARRLKKAEVPRTAAEFDAWYAQKHEHPVREELSAFLDLHGHVASHPWDGRSPTWSEDPWLLWRELLHRVEPKAQPPSGSPTGAATVAAEILTYAEDDDDLLARAYALWRGAAMEVAAALNLSPRAREEVFDLLPRDLEQLIAEPDPEDWQRAYQRGRSLAARWESWSPPGSAGEETTRRGLAASGGRAEGRVRRLTSALADGGPRAGDVLVVPTIVPADAIVFSRLAALITEQGEMLGHASILARDQGVPAVVGLPDARRWLASTERVLVDGDSGLVTRL